MRPGLHRRGSYNARMGRRRAHFRTCNHWLGCPWRRCRRACFHACGRRPGHDRPSGRLGCDCRGGRRWGHHNARFLPRLGNNPSRRGRWRTWNTLSLPTQIWPGLTWRTLAGCSRAGRTRGHATRAGRGRHNRCLAGHSGRYALHGAGGGGRCRMGWSGRLGCLGLSHRWNARPLRSGRCFIFSLLNRLKHVARFRDSRPVDLLLRLALYFRRTGTVLPAAMKVLAYTLCFIRFQRARVCLLFGHTDGRQGVKDRPALYFQLAC